MRHFVVLAGLSMLAASACSPDAFEASTADDASAGNRTPGITPGDPLPNDGLQQSEPVDPSTAPAENEPGSGE